MLGNCERMAVVTPPTSTNQLPQRTLIDDHKVSHSMASSGSRVMEKPGQELLQQQQQALKCPRCDSSNTKFCYYNNYSLSQPRHFCKACKRYWTRGGTLRNVPVGGGCRKNKRVKRPTTIDTASSSSCSPSSAPQPQIDAASTSNHINPLFYGLASNPCDVNLPFISRFNSGISSSGFDLRPRLSALGLGFSSGVMSTEAGDNNGYRNGLTSDNNNTLISSYSSIFSSSSSTCKSTTTSPPPVMMPNSSLLGSTLMMQQKLINGGGVKNGPGGNTTFQGLVAPLEQLQMASDDHSGEGAGMVVALKDVKVESGQNRLELWNNGTTTAANCQNQIEHVMSLSDPNSLYWNSTTALGAWNDQPNNIGPSVTSLI